LSGPPPLDWGVGRYEATALQLLPAAEVVVRQAALVPGERVLDLGCGTGNAALLAAAQGAQVTGVDPAARLLDVARADAAHRGLEIEFLSGDASAVPLDDASVDVVLSVFAVIFAPDPHAAAAEMARVVTETGRILLSAWLPGGAIGEMNGAAGEAVRDALGTPDGPPPFPWHDEAALADLFRPHGFEVSLQQEQLAFTAASAADYLDNESREHPMAVAGIGLLESLGQGDAIRARLLAILENGNEDPTAFRATSRYIVATARRA